MSFLSFLPRYFLWHYSVALLDFARATSNLFWFLAHFFSLELILKTFFVPWKRLGEAQGMWVGRVVVNSAMRVIGVGMRLLLFSCALVSFVLLACAVIIALALWLALPLVIIILFMVGIRALLQQTLGI